MRVFTKFYAAIFMALAALLLLALPRTAVAQMAPLGSSQQPQNLVLNGCFEDEEDPLNHWIYKFDHNKHYMNNHNYVSAMADPGSTRKSVMRLDASIHDVCINQGVMVYTAPIRFDPTKKYKISLSARSVGTSTTGTGTTSITSGPGPKCRIYPIGYVFHPKAKKSNNPAFLDLREAHRFQPIYFDNSKTGEFSNVPRQWKRVEVTIPTHDRSELSQSHLERCQWLMLKIVALDATGVDKCNTGYLYIHDVKIEEIGLANKVNITPGAATKGFDGKAWNSGAEQKKMVPIGGPVKSGKKK